VGWTSLSKWSYRCAYSDTAEISIYVEEKHRGKGIGKRLMKEILDQGQKDGLHTESSPTSPNLTKPASTFTKRSALNTSEP